MFDWGCDLKSLTSISDWNFVSSPWDYFFAVCLSAHECGLRLLLLLLLCRLIIQSVSPAPCGPVRPHRLQNHRVGAQQTRHCMQFRAEIVKDTFTPSHSLNQQPRWLMLKFKKKNLSKLQQHKFHVIICTYTTLQMSGCLLMEMWEWGWQETLASLMMKSWAQRWIMFLKIPDNDVTSVCRQPMWNDDKQDKQNSRKEADGSEALRLQSNQAFSPGSCGSENESACI